MPRRRKSEPVPVIVPVPPPPAEERAVAPPEPEQEPVTLVTILALAGLIGVAVTVLPVLSPFVALASLLFLLLPYRRIMLVRRSLVLASLLVALWAFTSLFGILVPFLIAFLIAYIFDPIVCRLAGRGVPRWVASLMIVLLFTGVLASVIIFVLPKVLVQFDGILRGLRTLLSDAITWAESGTVREALEAAGIPATTVRDVLRSQLLPRVEGILVGLVEGMLGLVSGVTSVALHIINAVIIPFLVFYLLMDFPSIGDRFYRAFPARKQQVARAMMERVDGVLGGYFRGAVIVAIIQGAISATALWIMGVHFALVLGIMTAVLNFIPYLGLVTSLIVASLVALFSGEPVSAKVAGVIVLYLSQKLLEATVLGPKIIGPQVGLHPVVLILCLMVFGYFLGFIGLLIAVPATALLLLAWESAERGWSA